MIAPTYTGATITKSAGLPVALQDARRQIRLDEITDDDELVRLMVSGISDNIERIYGVAMLTQTVIETHSAFPSLCYNQSIIDGVQVSSGAPLYLSIRPGVSVTSVTYIDSAGASQTFASSNYSVGTNSKGMFIVPDVDSSWPSDLAVRPNAVTVTYQAGFGENPVNVPASMRLAILNLLGKMDSNREDAVSEKIAASDILLSPFFQFNA